MLLLALVAIGLLCGFILMTRAPICASAQAPAQDVALIVPARDEEHNLPRLLRSLAPPDLLHEVIVADDGSTDRTRELALSAGGTVIVPGEPPPGVKGKPWACTRGAQSSTAARLLFLDADTFFAPGGLGLVLAASRDISEDAAVSVLPYAVTERPYEELSLFFNLLMAFGAGGFGLLGHPRLFGQSLLVSRSLYNRIGGHTAVAQHVLENFHMAENVFHAGGTCICFSGRGALNMRMFPHGMRQLADGWTKAFADGASGTDPRVLAISVLWLSALMSAAMLVLFSPEPIHLLSLGLYLVAVVQLTLFARQIGSFRLLTCILYPLPLLFFFAIFLRSALRRATHRPTNWRGRSV